MESQPPELSQEHRWAGDGNAKGAKCAVLPSWFLWKPVGSGKQNGGGRVNVTWKRNSTYMNARQETTKLLRLLIRGGFSEAAGSSRWDLLITV